MNKQLLFKPLDKNICNELYCKEKKINKEEYCQEHVNILSKKYWYKKLQKTRRLYLTNDLNLSKLKKVNFEKSFYLIYYYDNRLKEYAYIDLSHVNNCSSWDFNYRTFINPNNKYKWIGFSNIIEDFIEWLGYDGNKFKIIDLTQNIKECIDF